MTALTAPCVDYEIAHLELDLILVQITDLFRLDMAQRQHLAAYAPATGAAGVWNNHEGVDL